MNMADSSIIASLAAPNPQSLIQDLTTKQEPFMAQCAAMEIDALTLDPALSYRGITTSVADCTLDIAGTHDVDALVFSPIR